MTTEQFITSLLPFAKAAEQKYKVPALVSLAQAALESGWGTSAPGNMYFGIKAGSTWTGKKQLLPTTEYHDNENVKYPEIIKIEKISENRYKYKVKDWFRAYDSPAGSFDDHGKLLTTNSRYKAAFNTTDPFEFSKAIINAGYATADKDKYYATMQAIINSIKKKCQSLGLEY